MIVITVGFICFIMSPIVTCSYCIYWAKRGRILTEKEVGIALILHLFLWPLYIPKAVKSVLIKFKYLFF